VDKDKGQEMPSESRREGALPTNAAKVNKVAVQGLCSSLLCVSGDLLASATCAVTTGNNYRVKTTRGSEPDANESHLSPTLS
jgi:hypothetical protein